MVSLTRAQECMRGGGATGAEPGVEAPAGRLCPALTIPGGGRPPPPRGGQTVSYRAGRRLCPPPAAYGFSLSGWRHRESLPCTACRLHVSGGAVAGLPNMFPGCGADDWDSGAQHGCIH